MNPAVLRKRTKADRKKEVDHHGHQRSQHSEKRPSREEDGHIPRTERQKSYRWKFGPRHSGKKNRLWVKEFPLLRMREGGCGERTKKNQYKRQRKRGSYLHINSPNKEKIRASQDRSSSLSWGRRTIRRFKDEVLSTSGAPKASDPAAGFYRGDIR